MTKFELKQIIKGLIIESINESTSKNFVSSKKTKKLKEQDEMQPVDPQASAEPDAGELEGPESQDLDALRLVILFLSGNFLLVFPLPFWMIEVY